jgi:hypothetical protein
MTGSFKALHGVGSASPWFDTTVFSQPAGCAGYVAGSLSGGVYTPSTCTAAVVGLGNTSRNQFRGPGYIQNNLSLFKKFTLYRQVALETRIDAFQLSNTPQFGQPANSMTSGSFGKVTSTLGSGQGSVNGVGGGRTLQGSAKFTF